MKGPEPSRVWEAARGQVPGRGVGAGFWAGEQSEAARLSKNEVVDRAGASEKGRAMLCCEIQHLVDPGLGAVRRGRLPRRTSKGRRRRSRPGPLRARRRRAASQSREAATDGAHRLAAGRREGRRARARRDAPAGRRDLGHPGGSRPGGSGGHQHALRRRRSAYPGAAGAGPIHETLLEGAWAHAHDAVVVVRSSAEARGAQMAHKLRDALDPTRADVAARRVRRLVGTEGADRAVEAILRTIRATGGAGA